MGELDELIAKLNVATTDLKNNLLQAVLIQVKKFWTPSEQFVSKEWDCVADIMWEHLQQNFNVYDDHLLCATCFYSVIIISAKQEIYMEKILKYFQKKLDRKEDETTSILIALLYGMFQSAFFQKVHASNDYIPPILSSAFEILTRLGYDYAWYTFLVFKTMSSFKKVIGTTIQDVLFSKGNQIVLFNLVNQNWENPITGVRDLNRVIFQSLLLVMDKSLKSTIVKDINSIYWNKAKYLMLSEVIAQEHRHMIAVVNGTNWVKGLISSLRKPGLVSAGADMYFAMLKNIGTAEEWCDIFLKRVSAILTGKSVIAIQNFTNYWCLITFKTFPSLMSTILKDIVNTENHERRLLSTILVMKQGNKLGLLKSNMELVIGLNTFILQGLEHNNVTIRLSAFDIVCVSQGKSLPSREDYNLIYQYLLNNLNSDSNILRIGLLGSLKSFLIRLHGSFLNNLKSENEDLDENLTWFSQQVQDLVITSLNYDGNYQRKITSISLCDLIFTYFAEVPRNNQAHNRVQNCTLLEIMQKKMEWKLSNQIFLMKLISLLQDPAEDVRENVAHLLLQHYFNDLCQPHVFCKLKQDALKCISSKFFFEISCGHSMFKLLANILMKEKQNDSCFKSVEEIFLFGCKGLSTELKLKRDVMESIQSGKQLHSYMGVLIAALSVCLQNSKNLQGGIANQTIMEILDNLEEVSNQFMWEQEASISLDFSEMNDMVHNIISRSGYDPNNAADRTKISGMHQLVLNCLWLNVKTCCELSSLLIKYNTEESQADICKKCLDIITHVLETSRHKGAIEAAGAALGTAVQHLTSLPEVSKQSQLPNILLKAKLNELISDAGKMSSVTRRGAGLSIMLHRIVASDTRKAKPLFHHFMKTLLYTCKQTEDVPAQLNTDIDNEKDLPKAIFIHFLTRIVTDSSLASDLMHYSASLGELAFNNLTSKCWQIRNAALQLYGALVPKLIGQKKSSGEDKETISTVASDEFRMHLPELWKYMLNQLKFKNTSKMMDHSDLVPILNILANSARRYSFSYDSIEQESSYREMFKSLMCLLGSPLYTVRRLTAKCIYNNVPFEMIYSAIMDTADKSENFLHGCLILTGIYYKLNISVEEYEDMFSNLKEYFINIMKLRIHSYVTKTAFEEIFDNIEKKSIMEKVQSTFAEVEKNRHAPGIHLWSKRRIDRCIKECSWKDFVGIVGEILGKSDIEQFGDVVTERMLRNDVFSSELKDISEALIRYDDRNNYKSTIIWKIIYEISLTIRIAECDITNILTHFENNNNTVTYKSRYMIPVIATFIAYEKDDARFKRFVNFVFSLVCEDFELRYIAALANNNLSLYFSKLSDDIKVLAIKTGIVLIQDEDEDIRSLSVEFYENLAGGRSAPHPYICLHQLLKLDFLVSIFHEPKVGIPKLCSEIIEALQIYSENNQGKDQYNPFANDRKNIYIEVDVIKMLIERLQKQ